MSIKNTQPREIEPTHPGEMVREDFMPDFDLTAAKLAEKLDVSPQTVNELLLKRRAVSPLRSNAIDQSPLSHTF